MSAGRLISALSSSGKQNRNPGAKIFSIIAGKATEALTFWGLFRLGWRRKFEFEARGMFAPKADVDYKKESFQFGKMMMCIAKP